MEASRARQICEALQKYSEVDFPGGPLAKTPRFQCRLPESHPWSGTWSPQATTETPRAATKAQHSK